MMHVLITLKTNSDWLILMVQAFKICEVNLNSYLATCLMKSFVLILLSQNYKKKNLTCYKKVFRTNDESVCRWFI